MDKVRAQMQFNDKWINENIILFVIKKFRAYLFKEAQKQNIVLWERPNLFVLAAPME
jgi:hypothetical protein